MELFTRHTNVALSFSGGKDSLVCLYLLRPWWDRLTVYWLNTGDAFPETVAFMHSVRQMVPNFVELHGAVKKITALDGWPSDVVPFSHTTDGNAIFGSTEFKLQNRVQCCFRSLMLPTYNQMVADGVTCIIRGKRSEEVDRTGIVSGYITEDGVEMQFPLYDWTSSRVREYLSSQGIPLPKFYDYGDHSHDCLHCTAWWENGHAAYLKAVHPEVHTEYVRRIRLIKSAVAAQMDKCEVGD